MGEKENGPVQVTFNGLLKVAFQGSHITSDAGLILVRASDWSNSSRPTERFPSWHEHTVPRGGFAASVGLQPVGRV